METKVCNVCGVEKPAAEFYQPKSKQCKPCVRAAVKALENRPDPVLPANYRKKCRICKQLLPASSFARRERSIDKLFYDCKECHKTERKVQDTLRKNTTVKLPEDYTKKCITCNLILPAASFWYCGVSKDHLMSTCVTCTRVETKDRKVYHSRYKRTWRNNNKEKENARSAVKRYIKAGKIPSASSLVCAFSLTHTEVRMADEYHHWKGYSKENQLNVKPGCLKCHSILSAWERNLSVERLKLIVIRHSC